jgi:hypothetical protein
MNQGNHFLNSQPEPDYLAEFDHLFADIFAEPAYDLTADIKTTTALAEFLQGVMDNKQWSISHLAERLGHRSDLYVRAVLTGDFPVTELKDVFLDKLAQVIGCDNGVLRLLVGRDPREKSTDELYQLQEQLLRQLSDILFDTVDRRYSDDVRNHLSRSRQHDFVIRQLEMVIARQREELKSVQRLIDELNHPETYRIGESEIHILNLRRIIQRVKHHDNEPSR